ncbi:MAG: exo-alpha-sialidase [Fuerstiella sp.]
MVTERPRCATGATIGGSDLCTITTCGRGRSEHFWDTVIDSSALIQLRNRLTTFGNRLVDQHAAHVIVEPQDRTSGFWFGGGNMVEGADGSLYVVGRYRNAGDSRIGVAAGTRGLELAIFQSMDKGATFEKILSWGKAALNSPSGDVLSIEGSCLRFVDGGVELFVSTEKTGVSYPDAVRDFLKPGAGVWTIDVLRAASMEGLKTTTVEAAFSSDCPEHLHVKDPFYWHSAQGDRLGYCSHPFGWSSSNTGVVDIPATGGLATLPQHSVFPRGSTWDVAMTRGTCILPVPKVGVFAADDYSLLFYCGGECLRPIDEHATAVKRPRGYSCEEIGGAAFFVNDDVAAAERLSNLLPMFISPWGTGCSRYVDVLATADGFYVTWQQSQDDLSQPLVLNFVSSEQALSILADQAGT